MKKALAAAGAFFVFRLGPARLEERLYQRVVGMAAPDRDVVHQAGKRIELRIKPLPEAAMAPKSPISRQETGFCLLVFAGISGNMP